MLEKQNHEVLEKIQSLQIIFHEKNEKKIVFLANLGENSKETALLIFNKESFLFKNEEFLDNLKKKSHFEQYFQNDIFSRFKVQIDWNSLNTMDLQIIYPANDKLIRKYTKENAVIYEESYEIYQKFTKPFILKETESKASLQWIYNIFDKKSEVENIIFEDLDPENGFILLPDYSFDLKNNEDLHLIALSRKRDIYCLRELTDKHLGLLKNIDGVGRKTICEKFGINKHELRVFVHYQPTYYHFHVHFTNVNLNHRSFQCERAHNLTEIIQNIELKPDYYQWVRLEQVLPINTSLYHKYKQENLL